MQAFGSVSSAGTAFSTTSTLPPGHPPVNMHEHSNGACPVTREKHAYCPPQKGDLRSVCPALNTMANHGYIPRDGRNLTFGVLFRGLKACYGVSTTLGVVLVTGGFLGIRRSPIRIPYLSNLFRVKNPDGSVSPSGVIDLHLIGLHNGIEHDASLVHLNTRPGEKYPPLKIQDTWVSELVGDIQPPVPGYTPADVDPNSKPHPDSQSESESSSGYYASAYTVPVLQKIVNDPTYLNVLVDEADVGRMRARRQKDILPNKLNAAHAEIARGEMAIILGVWSREHEGKTGIPLAWLLQWLSEERLPEVPIPTSTQTPTPEANLESSENSESGSDNGSDSTAKTKASIRKPTSSTTTMMWRPKRKQTLSNVMKRSKAIRAVTDAIAAR